MSVTPRTLRAVTMPAAPRLRRTPRPFGTISLFLAATGILGLTSLCYLWQAGQATAAAMRIQTLSAQLQSAQNQWLQLEAQVARLKSDATVMQAQGRGRGRCASARAARCCAQGGPVLLTKSPGLLQTLGNA